MSTPRSSFKNLLINANPADFKMVSITKNVVLQEKSIDFNETILLNPNYDNIKKKSMIISENKKR